MVPACCKASLCREVVSKFAAAKVTRRKIPVLPSNPATYVGGYGQNGISKPLRVTAACAARGLLQLSPAGRRLNMPTISINLPPIVERELRVASRRNATYWSRVGAASTGLVIIWWVFTAQMAIAPAPAAGHLTFGLLAGVAAFAALGSVLQLSAEAFAREKREDTLGLLFLTPLRPFDLVLGKLVSTSLASFYRFLAMIPLLAIPMLAGGVTAADFTLLVLALINLIFLGATVGLWASARAWDEKRANTITTYTMLALTVLGPLLVMGAAALLDQPATGSFFALSPLYPVWQALHIRTGSSGPLWGSLAWTQFLGWLFFRAACRTLPHCWQTRPAHAVPTGEHLRRRERGELPRPLAARPALPPRQKVRAVVRREFATMERAHWLDRSPLLWLAMRCRPRSSNAWIIGAIGLAGYVPALLAAFIEGEWNFFFSPGLALFACFTVNAAFKTHVATQASFAFSRDRADDPLSLLLATPVTPRQLVEGHLLAIRETMRPWVGRALWIEGGWLAFTILIHASGNQGFTLLYALAALALLALLIPDLQAVGWTALWHGVIARNARAAEQEAFSRVLLLPWLTTIFVWIISFTLNNPRAGAFAVVLTWVMGSLIANSWFGRKSRRQLESKLALWALRRSTGELEHYDGWRRLGRRLGRWWAHQSVARS